MKQYNYRKQLQVYRWFFLLVIFLLLPLAYYITDVLHTVSFFISYLICFICMSALVWWADQQVSERLHKRLYARLLFADGFFHSLLIGTMLTLLTLFTELQIGFGGALSGIFFFFTVKDIWNAAFSAWVKKHPAENPDYKNE